MLSSTIITQNPNPTFLNRMVNLDFCDKHNMVAFLKKPEGSEGFHQIVDFLNSTHIKYALAKNPTIYVSLIHQFWQTTSASTSENEEMEITATIDGRVKTITEASIKRHLKLEDSDGISTLPNTEIFEQLALMRFIQIFLNKHKRQLPPHKRTYIALTLTLTQKLFGNMRRISKGYNGVDIPLFLTMLVQGLIFQGEGSTVLVESYYTPISAPSTSKLPTSPPSMQTTHVAEEVATMPYNSPILRVHSLRSDEGSMTLHELTVLCTTLSKKVESLESDLKQTKLTYGAAYTKLIMKVKKLENRIKSSKARRRVRLIVSKDEVSTAGAEVSIASPEVKTTAESLVYIKRSAAKRKDKGKAIMKEVGPVQKKTMLQLEQERLGYEEALRLQEQLDEKERQRIARVHEEANTFNAEEWDNIQAQIKVDEELAHKLQAEERGKFSKVEKAKLLVEMINERKRLFAQQRAEQRRNTPMTQAQQRTYMCNYIKNMGSHTLQQLKKLSFDEIKELFETIMKGVKDFVPMESDRLVPKISTGNSKQTAEIELGHEGSKRQKTNEE
ncbi:hypothetical protein Tco_0952706 [Tanacetum coccineum]|uniref:Uncharacterized protein n=1 Tax=Tanacetum coccineum TaxID=301880 RepID=A0ABQ5DXT4_9ASTR